MQMKLIICRKLLFICLAIPAIAAAQPGQPDITFNSFDDGTFGEGPLAGNVGVYTIAKTNAGNVFLGGNYEWFNNSTTWGNMTRLNANGSLVASFAPEPTSRVRVIAPQSDGKIYVGGDFTQIADENFRYFARLNADGTADLGFNPGTGPSSSVFCCLVQPDGKVIIGGNFTTYNGTSSNRIARLNTNGSIDASFVLGTGANSQVLAMTRQADGKIIITGTFTSYNGIACNRIARLNADGSFDASFNIGTGLNNPGICMQATADNKIVIGGLFSNYNGNIVNRLLRINADGSIDNGFFSGGAAANSVEALVVQPDGKIIAGGSIDQYNGTTVNKIFRTNTDGSIDAGFNIGTGSPSTIRAIHLSADGSILVGGDLRSFNGQPRNCFVKLNADGTIDQAFAPLPGANSRVNRVLVLPDQKILVGGEFTSINNTPRQYLARLQADGAVDGAFAPANVVETKLEDAGIQSTGKIITVSSYTLNGPQQSCVKRLNADGSKDNSFFEGMVNFTGSPTELLILPNDKMIVAGNFNNYMTNADATTKNRLVRLNADGSVDATFNPTAPNNPVQVLALQPDGKLLMAGTFNNVNGTATLVRLNTDGTVDNSLVLAAGISSGAVRSIAVQPDGKIIVGGTFTSYNGQTQNRIMRLMPDGMADPTFVTGTGFSNTVSTILLLANGQMIVTGSFFNYQGSSVNGVARLNADGSLDNCFSAGTGSDGSFTSLAVQGSKLIGGGTFTVFNNVVKHRILRLHNGTCVVPVTLSSFQAKWEGRNAQLNWSTAAESNSSHFVVERSFDGVNFLAIGQVAAAGNSSVGQNYAYTDADARQSAGKICYYRLKMVDTDASEKLSEIKVLPWNDNAGSLIVQGNPVRSNITLVFDAPANARSFVTIRNAAGAVVYKYSAMAWKGANTIKVPAGSLPSGVYYLGLTQLTYTSSVRIVKIN